MKLSDKEKSRLLAKYGPWALVTGASSGIGMELAKQLSDAGFQLILNGRDVRRLEHLSKALQQPHQEHKVMAADVSSIDGVQQIIAATQGLNLGLVVLSAGFGTSGKMIDSSLEEELNMLDVNCRALLMLTHHYSKHLAAQQRGGIILLSSMVAFQGTPYAAHYAATKAYVQSLAEGLAVELRSSGVDVLAAAPGPVSTAFSGRANMQMDMTLQPEQVGVPILKALGRSTTVLPGFLTKLLVYSLSLVPRWVKVQIMGKVMGKMTRHQRAVIER
jgi:short-subunit dehydrogenase